MSDIFPRGGGTHVFGVVKNAVTGDPVDAARVTIRTGGSEFTTISDSSGGFQWRDERLFTGEDVKIDVTCSGFEPWQETQVVEDNHLRLEVSLEPVKPESEETEAQRTETRLFRVRDANGDPVAGVEVRLEGPAGALGTAVSDTGGEARITMSVEAAEQTSTYTLRRQGFSDAAGGVEPGQDPVDIVIHPAEGKASIPGWWLVVAAAAVLGVLLSIVFFLRGPEPLVELGPQLAEVPDVVNKTLDEAIRSLQQAQLEVGQIEFVEGSGEPNTITWQSSAAGDHVDFGTMVDVRVAGGAPTVAVPSVIGLTQEQAVATLRAAGLVARTSFTSSSTARSDTALEQNPAANVQVAGGTTVLLEIAVSAEPEPVPPPLPSPPPAPEAPRKLNFQPLTVRPPFQADRNDPPAAAKDAQGIVYLRGYVTSETSDTNVLASLPTGLQPAASMTIPIWCTTRSQLCLPHQWIRPHDRRSWPQQPVRGARTRIRGDQRLQQLRAYGCELSGGRLKRHQSRTRRPSSPEAG